MGAAAGAFFCKNGHMTDCWGHHGISEVEYTDAKCEFCGEKATHFIAHGMDDSDFDQDDMPTVLREEKMTNLDDGDEEMVEIYDMTKSGCRLYGAST